MNIMALTQQTLAQLIALAGQHVPVRRFGVREANLASVIAAGIETDLTNVPTSALAGADTSTTGVGKLQLVAVATWDFATQGGAIGTTSLGITLPDNALITHVTTEVITAPTSTGSTGTIRLSVPVDGNITATLTADGAGTSSTASGGAMPLKLTAARALSVTIATNAVLSGSIRYYVSYVQSV
jgi:hypothetical protein